MSRAFIIIFMLAAVPTWAGGLGSPDTRSCDLPLQDRGPNSGSLDTQLILGHCVVDSLQEINGLKRVQIVQLRETSDNPIGDIPSAVTLSLRELLHSRALKQKQLLIVADDPLRHLDDQLCKELESSGLKSAKILGFGTKAWLANAMPFTHNGNSSTDLFRIKASEFMNLHARGKLDVIGFTDKSDSVPDELELLPLEAESRKRMLSNRLAVMEYQPLVVVNQSRQEIATWLQSWNLPQLYALEGGLNALRIEERKQFWTNQQRLAPQRRFRCEGA